MSEISHFRAIRLSPSELAGARYVASQLAATGNGQNRVEQILNRDIAAYFAIGLSASGIDQSKRTWLAKRIRAGQAMISWLGNDPEPVAARFSPVEHLFPEFPPIIGLAQHAPSGGITIAGRYFKGGSFIPPQFAQQAAPEQQSQLQGDPSALAKHEVIAAILHAMVKVASDAAERNDQESAKGELQALAALLSDPAAWEKWVQTHVMKTGVGGNGNEMQQLSWVSAGVSRSGMPKWRNTETLEVRYQQNQPQQRGPGQPDQSVPQQPAAQQQIAERSQQAPDAGIAHQAVKRIANYEDIGPNDVNALAQNLPAFSTQQLQQVDQMFRQQFGTQQHNDLVGTMRDFAYNATKAGVQYAGQEHEGGDVFAQITSATGKVAENRDSYLMSESVYGRRHYAHMVAHAIGADPKETEAALERYKAGERPAVKQDHELRYDHGLYFNTDKADATLPINLLKAVRQRPEGVINAAKYMIAAARGEQDKRDPIKVVHNGDGTYTVADGNSTFANAKKAGWKDLPVQIVGMDFLEAERKRTLEKETARAMQVIATPTLLAPEQALPVVARSSHTTEDDVFDAAAKAKPVFDQILDMGKGVSKAIGAATITSGDEKEIEEALAKPGPLVMVAGIKGRPRAKEKVNGDYGGDWSRLNDTVRATVAVDSIHDLPKSMEAIRIELKKAGWKVASLPKNKFETPTDAGYRDINLTVQAPDGTMGEIQLNTKSMIRTKLVGHKPYEAMRTIWSRAALEKRDMTPDEQAKYTELAEQQKALYGKAWEVSLGVSNDDELSDVLRHARDSSAPASGSIRAGEDVAKRAVDAGARPGEIPHGGAPSDGAAIPRASESTSSRTEDSRKLIPGGEGRIGKESSGVSAPALDESGYVDQAIRNLRQTSHTAAGVVDTSASKGKAEKMTGISGQEAADKATKNFEQVIRSVYASRNNEFRTPRQVMAFADDVAEDINRGILKDGVLERTEDSDKNPYTAVEHLPLARKQFSEELAKRLNDKNADPVETAAWIEWRANLTDHFWADGVGKTSKALAALPLIKAGLPLPQYRDNKEFFKYAQRARYDPTKGPETYLDSNWERFRDYYKTLMPGAEKSATMPAPDDLITKAIADVGGPDELTADSVEEIRRQLYKAGEKSPTHADIREAADKMKQGGWKPASLKDADAKYYDANLPTAKQKGTIREDVAMAGVRLGKSANQIISDLVDHGSSRQDAIGAVKYAFKEIRGEDAEYSETPTETLAKLDKEFQARDVAMKARTDKFPDGTNIGGWTKTTIDGMHFWKKGGKHVTFLHRETGTKAIDKAEENLAQETAPSQQKHTGKSANIIVAGGEPIKARYEVRDVGDVRASHEVQSHGGFRQREGHEYATGLQPRDYKATSEQAKVLGMAERMTPEFWVSNHPDATSGPPVITADGTVINGNGRHMALEMSRNIGTYDKYKKALLENAEHFGIDPKKISEMKHPALYRVVDMEPGSEEAKEFARRGNVATTQAQSPVRVAASLGDMVSDDVVDSLRLEGDTTFSEAVSHPEKGKVFREQLRKEIPAETRDQYFHENGRLTDAGTELVRNILLSKILPVDLIERAGNEMRGVKRTIEGAIPQLLKIKRDHPDNDPAPQLINALRVIARNPEMKTVSDADNVLSQQSLFGGMAEELKPSERMMLDFVLQDGQKPLVFRKKLGQLVNDLEGKHGLFGEHVDDAVTMAADALGVQKREGAVFGRSEGAVAHEMQIDPKLYDQKVTREREAAIAAGFAPAAVEAVLRAGEEAGKAEAQQMDRHEAKARNRVESAKYRTVADIDKRLKEVRKTADFAYENAVNDPTRMLDAEAEERVLLEKRKELEAADKKAKPEALGVQKREGAVFGRTEAASGVEGEDHQFIAKHATEGLKAASHIDDQRRSEYERDFRRVLARLPQSAASHARDHLRSVQWHNDVQELTRTVAKNDPNLQKMLDNLPGMFAVNGEFDRKTGQLSLAGSATFPGQDKTAPGHQVYAHEIGHVIDGRFGVQSRSAAWQKAFSEEISGGQLGSYAATNPTEAFAEFCRLIYGTHVSRERLERDFPLATAFFAKKDLLPVGLPATGGTEGPLQKIFDHPYESERVLADLTSSEPSNKSPHIALADTLADKLRAGEKITKDDLFDAANKHHGGTRAEGKYGQSEAYDSLEAGFNKYLVNATDPKASLEDAQLQAKEIEDRVNDLPTQTNRTGNKESFQQFSTPPHYSYAVAWLANLQPGENVLEPSAGTGSLAVHAANAGATVWANELDQQRVEFLKDQFGADKVFKEDAEQIAGILPKRGVPAPTTVLMNPPFSQTAGRMGNRKVLMTGANHISEALQMLAPGGRLVAIVGRGMAADSATFRDWFRKLKENHNLRANVEVSGGEYKKYGTQFGTRILVIDKTGPQQGDPITGEAADIPDLMAKLEGVRNDRTRTEPASGEQSGGNVAASSGPAIEPSGTVSGAVGGALPSGDSQDAVAAGTRGDVGSGAATIEQRPGAGSGDVSTGPGELPSEPGTKQTPVVDGLNNKGTRRGRKPGIRGATAGGQSAQFDEPVEPRVRPAARVTIEKIEKPTMAAREPGKYTPYEPARVRFPGAHKNPSSIEESPAMAAVLPPPLTYQPVLPKEAITEGWLPEEKLEAIAYAGQAHSTMLPAIGDKPQMRAAFANGDGTGVGKGRSIAGTFLDNWNQGRKKGVWITSSSDLIKACRRDFEDVGHDANLIMDFDSLRREKLPEHGTVVVTYATLARSGDPENPSAPHNLDILKNWLGADFDGVIAFDEAHRMANSAPHNEPGAIGAKRASQTAMKGMNLMDSLPNARLLFPSATLATEIENLGAFVDRLGLIGPGTEFADKHQFFNEMRNGGTAALECVAQELKASGRYVSRSLTFNDGTPEGTVQFDRVQHTLTEDQKAQWDVFSDAWQEVMRNINAAVEDTGGGAMQKMSSMAQFWGAQQRFYNQTVTFFKMPTVLKSIEADLAEGKSPVVQIVNTMQASTEREKKRILAEGGSLEDMDVSPREILAEFLKKAFPTQRYEDYINENGNPAKRPVFDSEGKPVQDPRAVAKRDAMLKKIGRYGMHNTPLDMLLEHFGHDNVSEITGRNGRMEWVTDPKTGNREKKWVARGKASNNVDHKAFIDGKKKILVFSGAGATGFDYHAGRKFANNAQRSHYLLQVGWRASELMQSIGRTHRTNQSSAPIYRLAELTDIPSERRFTTSAVRRLEQLGALTRGQRSATTTGLFKASDNLESDIAKAALDKTIDMVSAGRIEGLGFGTLINEMGLPQDKNGNLKDVSMTRFLNRLLCLKHETQNKLFSAFDDTFRDMTEQAAQNGTLDKGMEDWQAEKLVPMEENIVYNDPNSGVQARHIRVQVHEKTPKISFAQTKEMGKPVKKYVRNARSGKIWAMYDAVAKTDSSGRDIPQAVLRSPRGTKQFHPLDDVRTEPFFEGTGRLIRGQEMDWEELEPTAAESQWDDEHAATPDTTTKDEHFVSGALLRVWKKFEGLAPQLYRLRLSDGRTVVARHVPNIKDKNGGSSRDRILKRLGVTEKKKAVDLPSLHSDLASGNAKAVLENGWTLEPRMVQGERNIELKPTGGNFSYGDYDRLEQMGLKQVVIAHKTRMFIPTHVDGAAILAELAKLHPIRERVAVE